MALKAKIVGSGAYLPDRVVTNDDLATTLHTSDAWIRERTGIAERRYAAADQGTSDLAYLASLRALDDARITTNDLDLIIFATLTPDYFFPGAGVLVGELLGATGTPALDVRNQCSGFLYGLQVADAMIRAGIYETILLVGAEVHSTGLDFSDAGRDIAVLFGDGAGAVVVRRQHRGEEGEILGTTLGADGAHAKSLWCEAPASRQHPQRITADNLAHGDHFPRMNGRQVFRHAVTKMREATLEVLAQTGTKLEEVDLFIPHQANRRINDLVQQSLGVPAGRFYSNIARWGNTTAATIPICVDECRRSGRVAAGDLVCLVAFGSGFTWGATLVRL